jgi:hypothetical protein
MTSRLAKSRQEPLGPEEGYVELIARLIKSNRAERAQRAKAGQRGPTTQRVEGSVTTVTTPGSSSIIGSGSRAGDSHRE